MRVIRLFVVCLGGCLLLIRAQPAAAGGSWMHGEWDRYEQGETVTMVGFFGPGQQGWLDDGPFLAHVRPAVGSETEPLRTVLTAPVQFSAKDLPIQSVGIFHAVRVETTFVLPPDLPIGHYHVAVCNPGCKRGIGDLVGGPLAVGVNAQWVILRNWPEDDPSYARSQAMPPERRAVATTPTMIPASPPTTAAVPPTTVAPTTAAVPPTTVAPTATVVPATSVPQRAVVAPGVVPSVGPTGFAEPVVPRHTSVEPAPTPAVEPPGAGANWAGIVATSAIVMAVGTAGVVVRRRATPSYGPASSAREVREVSAY